MVYNCITCITQYITVYVGILKIQKRCITRRLRTGYLSHSNQHTQPLSYERYFLGLIFESRRYMYCFFAHNTRWLVSNVRRRPRRATLSGHDVAGQGFSMYLPKAKACLATRFGSTDVAADGRPSKKQAAAGQLAGGGAVNAHEAGHCAASESSARGRRACT